MKMFFHILISIITLLFLVWASQTAHFLFPCLFQPILFQPTTHLTLLTNLFHPLHSTTHQNLPHQKSTPPAIFPPLPDRPPQLHLLRRQPPRHLLRFVLMLDDPHTHHSPSIPFPQSVQLLHLRLSLLRRPPTSLTHSLIPAPLIAPNSWIPPPSSFPINHCHHPPHPLRRQHPFPTRSPIHSHLLSPLNPHSNPCLLLFVALAATLVHQPNSVIMYAPPFTPTNRFP